MNFKQGSVHTKSWSINCTTIFLCSSKFEKKKKTDWHIIEWSNHYDISRLLKLREKSDGSLVLKINPVCCGMKWLGVMFLTNKKIRFNHNYLLDQISPETIQPLNATQTNHLLFVLFWLLLYLCLPLAGHVLCPPTWHHEKACCWDHQQACVHPYPHLGHDQDVY